METDSHSRNLRLNRQMAEAGTFFVTKCLLPRKPVLVQSRIAEEIIGVLEFSVRNERILLASFVVMPDHWHALLCVIPPLNLPAFMQSVNTWIGGKSKARLDELRTEWQSSYYDTRVRSSKQFCFVCHYIENNPVEKGLVKRPEEWKWSSAHPKFADLLTRPWPWPFANEEP